MFVSACSLSCGKRAALERRAVHDTRATTMSSAAAAAVGDEAMLDAAAPADPVEEGKATLSPSIQVAELLFEYSIETGAAEKDALRASIMDSFRTQSMAPMYEASVAQLGLALDEPLLESMRQKNAEELKTLEAKIEEMREKFGDVEVFDARKDKAEFFSRIGDKEGALKAYDEIGEKGLSTGQRIDIAMAKMRLGIALSDWKLARAMLVVAKELNDKGGDWDRRNRLKVYEGVIAMVSRDFKLASALLLDSVPTFTATELFSFTRLVFYVVVLSLKELERPELKRRVIDSPDVLSVIGGVPHQRQLLNSLYDGQYGGFAAALGDICPIMARDRYLAVHAPFYLREMRVAAYVQFLESYKSVTMAGMASAFRFSVPFLDAELSRFIAAGRLNAKIDAVQGVIETTRPDAKNAQYHGVVKQGDALLNRVQRLSRLVAI